LAAAPSAAVSPATSRARQVKLITLWNADTAAVTATIRISDTLAGTTGTLAKVTLQPGEELQYADGEGFAVFDAGGAAKAASGGSALAIEDGGRIISSALPTIAAAATTSGTAYFVYMGRLTRNVVLNYVELYIPSTAGSGAQTAEIGVFSTPLAQSGVAQSMSKIVSTGTVDSLTTTGVKRNTADFNTAALAGTQVWCGFREAMATTRPQPFGLAFDYAQGRVQTLAASGVLTGAGPFAPSIPAASTAWLAPDLRLKVT
jgi:hypothetical protein